MAVSSLLHWKEKKNAEILTLKCLKILWSIVHKQKAWVTSSSAYLRIENLIENHFQIVGISIQERFFAAHLRGYVAFAQTTNVTSPFCFFLP